MLHFDLSENNESTPLYGATRAMILAGQKDAKKRVFLFFSIFFVVGIISELLYIIDLLHNYKERNSFSFHSFHIWDLKHFIFHGQTPQNSSSKEGGIY